MKLKNIKLLFVGIFLFQAITFIINGSNIIISLLYFIMCGLTVEFLTNKKEVL